MADRRFDVDHVALAKKTNSLIRKLTAAAKAKIPVFKRHLHEYFLKDLNPDKPCVIYDAGRGSGGVKQLSYDEVDKLAARIQKCVSDETDLRGFVGVLHPMNQYFPSIQLGIMRTGCAFLNLATSSDWIPTAERACSLLRMRFLLVSKELYDEHEDWIVQRRVKATVVNLSGEENEALGAVQIDGLMYLVEMRDCFVQEISYDDVYLRPFRFAYAMETSGTTGSKKFVLVPHRCITSNVEDFIKNVWKLTAQDVIWGSSPSTFDPSVIDLFTAMGAGGTILYTKDVLKYDGKALGSLLLKHGTTVLQVTPSFLRKIWNGLLSSQYFSHDQSSLKVLALGGEKCLNKAELRALLSVEMFNSMRALINLYGMTEMSCWASYGYINPYNKDPVCVGQALMETTVYTDTYARRTSESVDGYCQIMLNSSSRVCTVIGENGVVLQEDPQRGCSSLRKNIDLPVITLATGDLAILHNPNHLGVEIIGRLDSVVKRSGMKVPLSVIENAAMKTGFIKFAQGVELEGKIYLVVLPKEREASSLGLGEKVKARFFPLLNLNVHPEFYPNCVIAVHSVPVTPNGKLDTLEALRLATLHQSTLKGEFQLQLETMENVLHPLWISATGRYGRGVPSSLELVKRENFYEAGGTSVRALWFLEAIFSSIGMYGSPLLAELQEVVLKKLRRSSFTEMCCLLTDELKNNPITAQIKVISSELTIPQAMKSRSIDFNATSKNDPHYQKLLKLTLVEENNVLKPESERGHDGPVSDVMSFPLEVLKVFEYNMNMCIDAAAAVTCQGQNPGIAVVGSHSGIVIAVNTELLPRSAVSDNSVGVLWTQYFSDRVEAEAVVNKQGSFVYLGCYNGTLFKLSVVNGSTDSTFKCSGGIRTMVALNSDDSKVVVVDNDDTIYCLDADDLTLLWKERILKRLRPTFPPVIEGDMVLFTSTLGGVTGFSITTGCQVWPSQSEKGNEACTPPVIWNSPRGPTVVVGIPNGCEARDYVSGCVIGQFRTAMQYSWFTPVAHECKLTNVSEVVLTATDGSVILMSYDNDDLAFRLRRLDETNMVPVVLCLKGRSLDNTCSSQCYLLSNPTNSPTFLLTGLTEGTQHEEQVLESFQGADQSFSRPVIHKDMLIVGGRDNKLHILVCAGSESSNLTN